MRRLLASVWSCCMHVYNQNAKPAATSIASDSHALSSLLLVRMQHAVVSEHSCIWLLALMLCSCHPLECPAPSCVTSVLFHVSRRSLCESSLSERSHVFMDGRGRATSRTGPALSTASWLSSVCTHCHERALGRSWQTRFAPTDRAVPMFLPVSIQLPG